MASKVDEPLTLKFTSTAFDPEKCKLALLYLFEYLIWFLRKILNERFCSTGKQILTGNYEALTVCLLLFTLYTDVRNLSAECDTDAELQDHRKRIQALSEETAVSLKKNVYKNYMQFIETSKEISCILVIQLSRSKFRGTLCTVANTQDS